MNPIRFRHAAAVFALIGAACVGRSQNALYAAYNGKFNLVRNVEGHEAYVDDGTGKLVRATERKYSLQHAPEYMPVYVAVRNLEVKNSYVELVDSAAEINRNFIFRADFESPYALDHVFAVLDLDSEDAGKGVFLQEVGHLSPRDPKSIAIVVPLSQNLGQGHYKLHIFVDGAEVFHSQMPFDHIERTLDGMVRHRIVGVVDAQPKPFIGPAPEYPPKLRKAKVAGQAVIHFTISKTGRVVDPTIKSATDPAFGASALETARQWRFLPKVKGGIAVATTADLPFTFGDTNKTPKPNG